MQSILQIKEISSRWEINRDAEHQQITEIQSRLQINRDADIRNAEGTVDTADIEDTADIVDTADMEDTTDAVEVADTVETRDPEQIDRQLGLIRRSPVILSLEGLARLHLAQQGTEAQMNY